MAEPVGAELCCASCRTMRAFLHARVRVAVWRAVRPELPRAALATSAVMVLLTPRKAAGKA